MRGAAGGESSTALPRASAWQLTLAADPESQRNFTRIVGEAGTMTHTHRAVFSEEQELGVWKERVELEIKNKNRNRLLLLARWRHRGRSPPPPTS